MAFSAEIRARLGLDSSEFIRQINEVPAMVDRVGARLKQLGVGLTGNKSAKESAEAYQQIFAAEERLAQAQAKRQLQHAAGYREEIVLQREVLALKAQIDKMEAGTTAKLEAQVLLESKLLQLETMIAAQKQKSTAATGSGGAFGGAAREAEKTNTALDSMAKKMTNIFSLGNAIKGVFAFFAFASIDKAANSIARAISGVSEETEKTFEDLAELSTKVADEGIKAMRALLTEEKQYQLLVTERAQILSRLEQNKATTAEELVALKKDELAIAEKTAKINEYLADIEKKRKELYYAFVKSRIELAEAERKASREELSSASKVRLLKSDIAALQGVIASGVLDAKNNEQLSEQLNKRKLELVTEEAKLKKEISLDEKERHELQRLEAKQVKGLTESEAARLRQLRLKTAELLRQAEIQEILDKPIGMRTQKERDRLSYLQQQSKEYSAQDKLLSGIVEGTNKVADATQKVGKGIDSNIDKWEKFNAELLKFDSIGRGDQNLTDAELSRKERQLSQQIFLQEVNSRSSGGPFTASNRLNPLLEQQRSELAGAREEQRLRQGVRQSVDALGFEATLNRYADLTAARIEEIQRGKSGEETPVSILKQIRDRGIPTIVLNRLPLTGSTPPKD